MSDYRIVLANGHVHEGFDERDPEELLKSMERDDDELSPGWVWMASLYVKRAQIVAITIIPFTPQAPRFETGT